MIRLIGSCAALLLNFFALAHTRQALVIGIDDNAHVASVQKARNDAQAAAAVLRTVGFETDLLQEWSAPEAGLGPSVGEPRASSTLTTEWP